MDLITLIEKTATREELVELLRGTEEQRQQLAARNETLRAALKSTVRHARKGRYPADEFVSVGRHLDEMDELANTP